MISVLLAFSVGTATLALLFLLLYYLPLEIHLGGKSRFVERVILVLLLQMPAVYLIIFTLSQRGVISL
jgi:hypothetical protein